MPPDSGFDNASEREAENKKFSIRKIFEDLIHDSARLTEFIKNENFDELLREYQRDLKSYGDTNADKLFAGVWNAIHELTRPKTPEITQEKINEIASALLDHWKILRSNRGDIVKSLVTYGESNGDSKLLDELRADPHHVYFGFSKKDLQKLGYTIQKQALERAQSTGDIGWETMVEFPVVDNDEVDSGGTII